MQAGCLEPVIGPARVLRVKMNALKNYGLLSDQLSDPSDNLSPTPLR